MKQQKTAVRRKATPKRLVRRRVAPPSPRAGNVLTCGGPARVEQWLGSADSGCHGYQSLKGIGSGTRLLEVPGWDLPPGSEVQVEIRVTVIKLGKKPPKRCENPWPSHRCPAGKART